MLETAELTESTWQSDEQNDFELDIRIETEPMVQAQLIPDQGLSWRTCPSVCITCHPGFCY
ncbi:hypothetical protein EPA93_11085 [Ktedonosporobacter rubrisoli]|uniref:Uncharacterized protein n=1 Tax=Ktedonosporobacter rubrisoli TaxID=2509675 RepID=A0A4P6JN89_KTERU|nr:hypothetical protein EPA93_11085 [Ktedonosporobacter rubrisoli]